MADDEDDQPKRSKRTLPWLPEHGAPLGDVRDWLTIALGFPPGFYVEDFIRHGRGRTDGCVLIISAPGGRRVEYEIDEQRMLSVPASLRATIVSITDGLARVQARTKAEQEDVWGALVTLASVTVHQTKADEVRDWLDRFLRVTVDMTGHTFESRDAQFQALLAWRERPMFDRSVAHRLDAPNTEHERPVLFIDSVTGRRFVRVSDLLVYIRHVVAPGPVSQANLSSWMSRIGAESITYAIRRGDEYPRLVLFRLAEDPPDEA